MTLCIGAECKHEAGWATVNIADTRRETGGEFHELIGSEDASKISTIGPRDKLFHVLISGIPTKAVELIANCRKGIEELVSTRSAAEHADLAVTKWFQSLRRTAEERKREIIDHYLQMSLGIGQKEFLETGGKRFTVDHYNQLWHEIRGLDLGTDLLFTGFFNNDSGDNEAIILRLDRQGDTHWESGYGVTGVGSDIALAFLCQREYNSQDVNLMDCLFRLAEAKKAAERNRHVGDQSMILIAIEGKGRFRLTKKGWSALDICLAKRQPIAFENDFIEQGE